MIVKEVVDESILTLAEAKELLRGVVAAMKQPDTGVAGEEMGDEEEVIRYEQRKALEHTSKFAKLNAEDSRALIGELLNLEKMNERIAVQIVNLMPGSKNEVRAIYAKEDFTLSEEDIEAILDCVAKYR